MRRFLPFLTARLVVATTLAGLPIAATLALPATPAAAAACAPATTATYRHTFDGPGGTVTITADTPLCKGQTQAFSLVSYTTGPLNSATGQFLYDSATTTITPTKRSVTLRVAVPACFTQVDAILGSGVRTETTSTDAPYGAATLGAGGHSAGPLARYVGGTTACTAAPTVSFTNACDGTFTATLANDDHANARAVFLTGSRRIRLSPGDSTTIKAARNSTLTIRTSTYTTYVGTWRPPTTPCTAVVAARPAPTGTVRVPTAAPTRKATAPTTSPASSTAAGNTAEPPGPVFSVNPDALSTAKSTALANAGRGWGSILLTATGFLMIGGGVVVLNRLRRALGGTF